ncbi:hypothetical protein I8752_13130 [Nostocaceae cyanobacterium CENA369]|uniref:Uncharacterized protein n=1 Tax=Dendronalium phyllosphericum CENA369 TaxID=1725256 RepID=A0A8J7I9A0_9NOST|nr:hypothetical protein [Dendronalium phyllosphericum]MBH8573947.1 hypothetical protein [Dendronalium phyllosphericum CENA369]
MSISKKIKNYCKWFWDESLGGEYDAWGTSTYFMEVGADLCPVRQIEVYENGNVLFYDSSHFADNYGMLCDKPLGEEDIQEFGITKAEFEQVWNTKTPMNMMKQAG